jgi:hypothetical protein
LQFSHILSAISFSLLFTDYPLYLSSRIQTLSFGIGGLSGPHTWSIKFGA